MDLNKVNALLIIVKESREYPHLMGITGLALRLLTAENEGAQKELDALLKKEADELAQAGAHAKAAAEPKTNPGPLPPMPQYGAKP